MAERGAAPVRVLVASANPVKRRAVELAWRRLFADRPARVEARPAPSGVADQPKTDAETRRGARNRARNCLAAHPDAELAIGLEGGVEELDGELTAFAWAVARWPDGSGRARTASFALPPEVARLVRSGLELGEADDRVFGRSGSKRREGAVGLLTGGAIDRAELYAPAVLLALVPYARPELYPPVDEGSA